MRPRDRNNACLYFILTLLFTSLFGNWCSAQYEQIIFDHVTAREGLSQSSINYIMQDHNGFLWFATYNGLNKYDGHSFKVYRKNNKDLTSISGNDTYYLFEDNQGYLWIVNHNTTGLDCFDPKTETFVNYSHDPSDPESISNNEIFHVTQDSKGNIWICAGNALNLFISPKTDKYKQGRFVKYMNPNPSSKITWAFEDINRNLLVFADSLYYFNYPNKRLKYSGVSLGNAVQVNSVVNDRQNNILLGTILHGVIKLEFDKATTTYRKTSAGIIDVTPNRRSRLCLDSNHHLWIATEEGLYRYKPETEMMEHFVPDDMDSRTISDRILYSIYEDKTGVLWIGTFSKGLDKYDFYRKQFLHFKKNPNNKNSLSGNVISSIHGINPNELWVGLDVGGGINRIIFSGNQEPKIIHYLLNSQDSKTNGENSILCLVQRKNGEVWTGSSGGTISRLKPEPPSGQKPIFKKYLFDKWTFSIYEDSDGILWGGTWDKGLWRYDDKTDQFDFFLPDSGNRHSISDKVIWSIGEDQHKNIWIGGHGYGISVLTADEKRKPSPKFINFNHEKNNPEGLSNNTINAFCQAKDGTLWICTAGGLNKVVNHQEITGSYDNFPDIKFQSYNMGDGLPSDGIVGIVEDNKGYIWVSTTFGISKMNPQKEEFVNYNEGHGLQSNEFWHNAYFKDASGMIFFGGENGFNAFKPENIITNPFLPKVVLTELLLFNNTVKVGDPVNNQVVLKEPIHRTKEIVLNYKNNFITLQFAALHYAQPSQNKYAYYLEGFENSWNYSGNQRSATYTNLDPGNYTFRVRASNNDGIWSDKEIALGITIKPPWWKTLFVKIAAPFFLVLLTMAIFRIRLSVLKQQKKVLQLTVNNRTEELQEANTLLEEKQEEILMQNDELLRHRNNLEELVNERTFELEKAKQKAEESDRLKSSFLANMSHEIRTPMNAILGFSFLLKETEFSEDEREGFIRTINSNGEALMVLIDDILDISMIESNQMVLNPQHIYVNALLIELEDYYRLKNDRGLTIEFANNRNEELILYVDPVRFRQIMSNLLSNAYKYTNDGYIRFGYDRLEHVVRFFVSDSGIGIDEKYSENIFNNFFKIELQTEKVYRGTGIGLAICKRLVELLHGRIWVESKLGSGSTFFFTIPYMTDADKATMQLEKKKEMTALTPENSFFVIAEDEPNNYEVLVKMLRIPDNKHFWGKNGKEVVDFIKKLDNHNNVIVLMDIKMPVMNGYEAITLIKEINAKIPVIAVTAFALKHEEKNILEKGFDGYLAKPIMVDKLKAIIGRFTANNS